MSNYFFDFLAFGFGAFFGFSTTGALTATGALTDSAESVVPKSFLKWFIICLIMIHYLSLILINIQNGWSNE